MSELRILDVTQSGDEVDVTVYGGDTNLFGTYSFYSSYAVVRNRLEEVLTEWMSADQTVIIEKKQYGRLAMRNTDTGDTIGAGTPCRVQTERSENKGIADWGLAPRHTEWEEE